MADRSGITPLYETIRQSILNDISSGVLSPGDLLPTEQMLCEKFSVSRITVRRAVSELCDAGHLVRQQGRGTFVARPRVRQTLISLSGFTEALRSRGCSVKHVVLDWSDEWKAPEMARKLAVDPQVLLCRCNRLIEVDGAPLTLETLYFEASRFPKAAKQVAQGGSFSEALNTFYGVQPHGARRLMDVGYPRPGECESLDTPMSTPIYRIDKLVLDDAGRPLSNSLLITPVDRVTWELDT